MTDQDVSCTTPIDLKDNALAQECLDKMKDFINLNRISQVEEHIRVVIEDSATPDQAAISAGGAGICQSSAAGLAFTAAWDVTLKIQVEIEIGL